MNLDEFFSGYNTSRRIFDALRTEIGKLGSNDIHITKSQISFYSNRTFARVWIPDRYLHSGHAPLVLTLSFPHRIESLRWKEVIEPSPGHFTHHLELYSESEIDTDVIHWITQALNDTK